MKSSVSKNLTGFVPFTLNITVETLEEANALYAVFNYVPVSNLLTDAMGEERHVMTNTVSGIRLNIMENTKGLNYYAYLKTLTKDGRS